ncbi:hypothetical protein RS86_03072 [Microbacterium azadirachtae]|uniref:Uncharacterized protein n=2 Tax=Microbacterium azadirachtae TaxID=582680 RepID=A0A0F0LF05_9MICO|nr:hypothetical protein RS86_03072 [Microbacterium azadirachtae]
MLGFLLRVNYVEKEGVHLDWMALLIAAAGTVVLIVGLALIVASRRRAAGWRGVAEAGISGATVIGYSSRIESPPFLTQEVPGPRGRGLEVAITADSEGIHVRALLRGGLTDFGLIPWSRIKMIGPATKSVGVGLQLKSGVLHIDLNEPTPPYANQLEFFPTRGTATDAASLLTQYGPRSSQPTD